MAWMRDLALFGLVFCSSLVPARASLDSRSHPDFLLPQVAEYDSSSAMNTLVMRLLIEN